MKDMGTGKLSCWEGKTEGGVAYPHKKRKNYTVESGLNAKEKEMDTIRLRALSFGFDFTFT